MKECIEQAEIEAWKDLIDSAPESFKLKRGLRYKDIGGGTAINFFSLPIPLFNRVIGLGLNAAFNTSIINEIKAFYSNNEKYIVHF
jgi:hypothetical protein